MDTIDWRQALHYADLQKVASSVGPSGSYDDAHKARLKALGYEFRQAIYGNELATDIREKPLIIVPFGFIALSATKELVVAIRGTASIFEWAHNIEFPLVPSPIHHAGGFTELGFTQVYCSLFVEGQSATFLPIDAIKQYFVAGEADRITICGHSLGAALATLLTLDVALNGNCSHKPTFYDFASPRVGEHIFVKNYNNAGTTTYRIVNRFDLVPKLPPILPLPYDHVQTRFELVSPPNTIAFDLRCMHHLTTYMWLMDKQIGASDYPLDDKCKFRAEQEAV